MSIGRTLCVALVGFQGRIVEIEADISLGLPGFVVVGLPDTSLFESRDRVRSAAANSGCSLPARKITVNLIPASLPKKGSGFDLAIAMAVFFAMGLFPAGVSFANIVFIAELGLDGRLRAVKGVLPAVLAAVKAGFSKIVVADDNFLEAKLVAEAQVSSFTFLVDLVNFYDAKVVSSVPQDRYISKFSAEKAVSVLGEKKLFDFSEVLGQDQAKYALEVAAAGGHHVLLVGPPGAGKTMLIERLVTILPRLNDVSALEVSALYSLAGSFDAKTGLLRVPPFESPHHSATVAAIVGGGSGFAKPGAVSLAHCGVLFLDEAPQFKPQVLDSLREPLEKYSITIHRSGGVAHYPARFQLVLAANPCLCGKYFGKGSDCTCNVAQRMRYFSRLSGPLLDRIDLQLYVSRMKSVPLQSNRKQVDSSATILARVEEARKISALRLKGTGWCLNSEVSGVWLREKNSLCSKVTKVLDTSLAKGTLTLRGYDRVLRVAWTISDLAGQDKPDVDDIGLALLLRQRKL